MIRPAWEGSDRRARLPAGWAEIRAAALERDGHQCRTIKSSGKRCTNPAREVDHVERGDNHDLANLAAICVWHHRQKTAQEGHEAATASRGKAKRRPRRHPGLTS